MVALDAGKPVTALAPDTQSQIANFNNLIKQYADVAGISALAVAAPMAREMNKQVAPG